MTPEQTDVESEYFVAAIANQETKVGYRLIRVWANSTEEAIGTAALRLRKAEPKCSFSEFDALVATPPPAVMQPSVAEAAKVLRDDQTAQIKLVEGIEDEYIKGVSMITAVGRTLRALSRETPDA